MKYIKSKDISDKVLKATKFAKDNGYKLVFAIKEQEYINYSPKMIFRLYKDKSKSYCYSCETLVDADFNWFIKGVYNYINSHIIK